VIIPGFPKEVVSGGTKPNKMWQAAKNGPRRTLDPEATKARRYDSTERVRRGTAHKQLDRDRKRGEGTMRSILNLLLGE